MREALFSKLYLSLVGILLLFVSCNLFEKSDSPIPSFCAAEPDWGPNNLIVFANQPWHVIPPETSIPSDSVGLWTIKADGSESKYLVSKTPDGITFSGWAPRWFPDGKWIAAMDDISRIWKVTPDGESLVLFHQWQRGEFFSISPDARKIAFATNDSDALGPRGVRILDLASGTEKFVFPYGTDPSWFPDGSRLVFHGWLWENNRWTAGIIVVDTSGENAQMIHRAENGVTTNFASFSPDGKKVVFHQQGQVWIVNADGTNPRRLTTKRG